jgi:hypothetical protein
MFRERPELVATVLNDVLGVKVPTYTSAQLSSSDLTDVTPTEYRADSVITFSDESGPTLAVVVEAQLGIDYRKRFSWPVYVATLRARLERPVILMVVCPRPAVAAWCAEPIADLTPGGVTLTPLVLGPGEVPVVTDLDEARRAPEITVLSAMTHGAHTRHPEPVFHALLAALSVLGPDHAGLYADLVLTALPAAARQLLEECMTTAEHRYRNARGIEVPEDVRERITSCTELDQLETWIRRAATVGTARDLFSEEPD